MPVDSEHHALYLSPGAIQTAQGNTRIRTLLGSCIAITLWHPGQRIGGMCHYLLARHPQDLGRRINEPLDARYAEDAMHLLVDALRHQGAFDPAVTEAKLFGGGCMLSPAHIPPGKPLHPLQLRNIEVARALLAHYQLPIRAEHVGGFGHRQVIFEIDTGHVWIKHTPL